MEPQATRGGREDTFIQSFYEGAEKRREERKGQQQQQQQQYDRQQACENKNRSAVDGTPVSGPGGPPEGESTILRAPDWPGQNAPAASQRRRIRDYFGTPVALERGFLASASPRVQRYKVIPTP
ncbi:hypothetical protein BO70DRAFT_379446 [Aspergillus heteromorphus CBS 117.55]|uniref:Uncharacterized protein n=1 Tax=Aspergillus heteromorphus CBS 117.55 TaxID=1448321 RepID=A0A317W8E1_9EURO|nr:uncharacterized protein BO70DRAFT_379446 [Aspergillus heteromorphus CBS 117.55]PWY82884.1 hypothetical protein BO70DRAFT_379446 [Aspergillus heteromorphus CBS 117.55]